METEKNKEKDEYYVGECFSDKLAIVAFLKPFS
jgi:hypothetical protein